MLLFSEFENIKDKSWGKIESCRILRGMNPFFLPSLIIPESIKKILLILLTFWKTLPFLVSLLMKNLRPHDNIFSNNILVQNENFACSVKRYYISPGE